MREELCDALDAAAVDAVPVLLHGAGQCFSSGGDLDEFGSLVDPVDAHFVRIMRSVPTRLQQLRPRLKAAVHGTCVGSGVEFAAFASRLLCEPGTTFRLPEVGMGLIPGAGGTVSIPARIGRRPFLEMALLGKEMDAKTALALGLVDEIVPNNSLLAALRGANDKAEIVRQ
jgi:enoyl-CoA hydratase/carnithine racemase